MWERVNSSWFQPVAANNPKSAVKLLTHVADQIQGDINRGSAKTQIITARVEHDDSALEIATSRDRALRDKFMSLLTVFFDEQATLAGHVTTGESRIICDVLYQEQGSLN